MPRLHHTLAAVVVIGLVLVPAARSQEPAQLREADRVRIAEAFRLAREVGEPLWPGWSSAPFTVLLVTPEREFLIRHPAPTPDFTRVGRDALLEADIFSRPRIFETNLLASFPAVGETPTIVIGQQENTAANTSTAWTLILLHEHFHQWQYAQPGYYTGINALGLAVPGAQANWVLNYAFPYEAADVGRQFAETARLLADAVPSVGGTVQQTKLDAYFSAKRALRALVSASDYTYLNFQIWQEGVSRYTEYRVAADAAASYRPSPAFLALPDVTSFESGAKVIHDRILRQLRNVQLATSKRASFYAMGAAEALLLDSIRPAWRSEYAKQPYTLDRLLGLTP